MTSFKYTAATLALLMASGMAYAANSTQQQPAAQGGPECPAAGSVADADLPAECKTQAVMPKQDDMTTGAVETLQPDPNATTTTEMPKQDSTATRTTAATVVPKSYNATASETKADTGTAEIPKTDDTATGSATTVQPEATAATTTTEMPKLDDTAAGSVTTEQPETTTAATTEMPKQDSVAATAAVTEEVTAANVNSGNAVLASQFMGQTVYSGSNENVGEINDIVMNRDLDNVIAIIGVGGFLGIGEKDVAIPIEEITVVKDENNNLKLTVAATKEQLEAAPAFDRTALK